MGIIRTPFVSGTTLNNPLAIGGTTLSSVGLGGLAAVASPDVAKVILDPGGLNGNPEVVYVTAHTAAATTATISRAAEGTTAREHPVGTTWVVGPTSLDWGWTTTPATPTLYNPLIKIWYPEWSQMLHASVVLANTTLTANTAYLTPMNPLPADVSITTLVSSIGVQSGNVDVGIYIFDGTTFTKIVSLGSTACPAVAASVTYNITDTVCYAGVKYYLALAFDNAIATTAVISSASVVIPSTTISVGGYTKAASFPLPTSIASASASATNVVLYGTVAGY